MVTIARMRVAWTGWAGGPGVSTFYAAAAPTPAQLTALRTFVDAIKAQVPTGISLQVENTGQIIDAATGKAVDTWSGASQSVVNGTGTGSMSSAAGVYFRWNTGVFNNGRQVRGKTYLVPCVVSVFDSDGTINNPVLNGLQTIVNTFVTGMSGGLVVYSPTAHNGFVATSGTVIDRQVVMRSRRA